VARAGAWRRRMGSGSEGSRESEKEGITGVLFFKKQKLFFGVY